MKILWQEVRRLYTYVPPLKALDGLRLTENERRLLDLIVDQGPPPPGRWEARRGARKAYFTRLAKVWGQSHGRRVSADALRKAWDRLRPRYEKAFAHIITGGDHR